MNDLIFDLQRFVTGTSYSETLTVSSNGEYVYAYGGNDSIYNYWNDSVRVYAGEGNDTIHNRLGYYQTMDGGADNDRIINDTGWYASINGGSGSDIISLSGNQNGVTVKGDYGNDLIYGSSNSSYGVQYQFYSGDGYDAISNWNSNDTLNLGGAYYTRSTVGSNVVISLTSGSSGSVTLIGASGKTINITNGTLAQNNSGIDTVNYTDSVEVNGTSYNDTISNYGDRVTILAGYGKDTIYNNKGDYALIYGGYGDDSIDGNNDYTTIYGGDGNDTITGNHWRSVINGNNDNDLISLTTYWYNTIDGGSGNDTIYAGGGEHSVNGGAGADRISLSGDDVTVRGGAGNDIIYGSTSNSHLYQFYSSDGYDTIYNWSSDDTLNLGGAYYTRSTVSGNVVISLTNGSSGSVTLNGASGKTINITNGYLYTVTPVITNTASNTAVNGTSGNDTISISSGSYQTVYANAGDDSIYNGNADYSKIYAGAGNDSIRNWGGHQTIYGGDGADIIRTYSFEDLIYGDAGNDSIFVEAIRDHTLNGGTGNDYISISSSAVNNLIQYASGDGNDIVYGFRADSTLSITGGSYSTTKSGNDVIVTVGNGRVTLVGAASLTSVNIYPTVNPAIITNTVSNTVVSGTSGNDTIYNYGTNSTINALGGNDSIGSYRANSSVNGGAGNDTIDNTSYGTNVTILGGADNDSVLNSANAKIYGEDGADTITNTDLGANATLSGGNGNDYITTYNADNVSINGDANNDIIFAIGSARGVTVRGGAGNDEIYGDTSNTYGVQYQVFTGDGKDTIYNWNSSDTLNLGGAYYTRSTVNGNVVISLTNGSSGSVTLSGASGKTINIIGGTLFSGDGVTLSNNTKYSLVSGGAGNDNISNSAGGVTIRGNGGNDYIYNSTTNTINNSYGYVTINGGDGNDSITSYDPYVSISGGAGADRIYTGNWRNVTIKGGYGNDTIYGNNNEYGILYQYAAGDGYDSIVGYSEKDTITITGGSWSTTRSGSDVIVNVAGSNVITLVGAYGKTININPGENRAIVNYNDSSVVSGTSGNDSINNYGDRDTVNAGGGNDTIYNDKGDYAVINAGDGRDSIRGNNDYTTVNAGNGSDTITGNHWRSRLNGDGDNDLISITTYWYNTLDGGYGDDTIIAGGSEHSVNGGAGSDRISLSGDNVTVRGGTGNDSIVGNTSTKHLYQYSYGDGYDTIYNWSSTDTLKIIGGKYKRSTVNNDIVVTSVNDSGVTNGAITLVGAKGKSVYIDGDPFREDKTITNTNSNTTVNGTSYNDTVKNSGYNVTVNAGAGDDSIYSNNSNVSLNGNTGKDTISVASGSNYNRITIKGGGGNDVIYGNSLGGGILYQYGKGDGSDIIYGYKSSDSITITGDAAWTTVTSGNNVLVNIADSGTITLSGANGKTINVFPKKKNETVTPQDVIKKFMESLDKTKQSGVNALNEAVRYATNGYFSNIQAAINQMVADCQRSKNATTFLKDYCNIDLTNSDTGAITGYDAGGSTYQKTGSGIVPENGSLENFTGNSFTINGLTVQLSGFDGKGNPYAISYSSLSNAMQKYIWQAAKTWWIPNSLNLLSQSYGNNFGFSSSSSATVKKIYFGFRNSTDGALATTYTWGGKSDASQLAMAVNMNYYNGITIGDVDGEGKYIYKGKEYSAGFLDRTLAHEFTHAVMSANIYSVSNLPQFLKEGMSELTHGIDDERNDLLDKLAGNSTRLGNSLNLNDNNTGTSDAYAGGYMFLRYLAKQGAANYQSASSAGYSMASKSVSSKAVDSSVSLSSNKTKLTLAKNFSDDILDLTESGYSSVKTVTATELTNGIMVFGNTKALSISMGSGKDSVFANTGNDTIDGGAGSDVLYGEAGNDSINGGTGADTISGGTGTDSLYGGKGKDLFVHKADKDIIVDYTPGEDKIKLAEEYASITASSLSGNDVVLTVNDRGSAGTIVVKGAKGKKITVIEYDGNETSKVYGPTDDSDTLMTVTNSTSSPVTVGSAVKTIDASTRTTAVKITGNTLANSIKGGSSHDTFSGGDGNDSIYGGNGNDLIYGQTGNDKLYGQAGNDSLYGGVGNDSLSGGNGNDYLKGGDGNDIFIFSAGNDVIADFTAGQDKIKLSDASITSSTVSGSDVVFTLNTGKITVTGGKNQNITIIDASGKETTKKYPSTSGNMTLTVTKDVTLSSSYQNADASALTKAVKIAGNSLANSIKGGSGNDSLSGLAGKDTLTGGNGKDTLTGGDGNDLLYGQGGDDKVYGQGGNDSLYGGAGNDSLWGGVGNDWLKGGEGNDWLKGGEGSDTFVYNNGDGKDTITAFDSGDLLQITGTFSATYNKSKKEIYFKVGSTDNAITLTDFGSTTTFHVNNDTYRLSGNQFKK